MKSNSLYEIYQSAYRSLHSTETALLRVQNDILKAVDINGGAILILLDLSAAFDTIDQNKLLELLNHSFGIRGNVLKWFSSYLTDRTQSVKIGDTLSDAHKLSYGVPQGSVLGPILFVIYTTSLGSIIRKHGLTFHLYADDTQLYIGFKPSNESSVHEVASKIEACISDIRIWMTNNQLKLNDDKTEILVITSNQMLRKKLDISIKVGEHHLKPSETPIRNLGVLFDSVFDLKSHVSNLCKHLYMSLYSLGKIRKYLDKPTTEKIVNATITSKMDYCNSLLYGMKSCDTNRLQLIQNQAARIVTLKRKRDHITPVLRELYWLPIVERVTFKILLMTYKAQCGLAPDYIASLINPYQSSRIGLRSESLHLLDNTERYRLKSFGKRAFSIAAPSLWNSLPLCMRQVKTSESLTMFKKNLKNYLFKSFYR